MDISYKLIQSILSYKNKYFFLYKKQVELDKQDEWVIWKKFLFIGGGFFSILYFFSLRFSLVVLIDI